MNFRDSGAYVPISSYADLRAVLEDKLHLYETEHPRLGLVLFEQGVPFELDLSRSVFLSTYSLY